ncbi:MAG TPA: PAS domain S-box protein, partial [Chloroflexota bacterium]
HSSLTGDDEHATEYRLIRGDGETRWLRITTLTVSRRCGVPSRVVGTMLDLTDRRRLDAHLQLLLASTGEGIYGVDLEGRCTFINAAGAAALGYEPDQLLGRQLHLLIHHSRADGANYPVDECPILTALGSGSGCRVDTDVLWRRDGTPLAIDYAANPMLRDGIVSGAVVTFRDIGERKEAEARLRSSEERLRLVTWATHDAIWDWNIQTGKDTWSVGLDSVLGYTVDGLGTNHEWWARRIHPDDRERVLASIRAAIAGTASTWSDEYRFLLADGTYADILDRGYVVRDAGERALRMIGAMQDVTEQKAARKHQEALTRTEKMRALGQMASGVAHDLNQYLAVIAGHADLAEQELAEGADRVAVGEHLRTLSQAAMDGGETVKRLLAFARQRADGPPQQLDLASIVEEVAQLTTPRWRQLEHDEGRSIELRVEIEHGAVVQGWPARLRQAVMNLVFNAVDALPNGGTICLSARREAGTALLEVSDNGIGMPPEVQSKAFEPFFTTKGERGTGLGLAQVFGIVEEHLGQVALDSTVGRGTTVRLRLPVADSSDLNATGARGSAGDACPSLRVLAVDDEPLLARMVVAMLSRDGHIVESALSGEQALVMLGDGQFDLVITDLGLGHGLNGWDLTRSIKDSWPSTGVILATGWGAAIDPESIAARGAEAVVTKPYRLAELRRVVSDFQTRRSTRRD